ncbi:FIST signal transduction protein [Jidongwangia harbinensis]|uniref:FIST signal transduction protein n=1 Tax=Jidongwangia harbinensis TaxID=2878561 RepID=UPI001CDA38D2|nr:FIST N-terminal domain-containing protein [Jidongwangia harbinensis]MCA2215802.1 FIST C-terminal domain-containing protein [Jidongwangia harbinensis]
MSTPHRWFGAGHSTADDSAKAGAEAGHLAIGGRSPALVLVFCSSRHDLAAVLLGIGAEAGDAAVIAGCTTLGELTNDGAGLGGVVVAALGGPGFAVRSRVAYRRDAGDREAGAVAAEAMTGLDHPHRALLLLGDGLSGTGYEVVQGAYGVVGATVPLVGGFADDPELGRTFQFHGTGGVPAVLEDTVVGVAIGSDGPIGVGAAHGWHPVDPPMVVTGCAPGRIDEWDGEPAMDVLLRRYGMVGRPAADLFDSLPVPPALGVSRHTGQDVRFLYAGDDGSVRVSAEVPPGSLCWLMNRDETSLRDGAVRSCREAVDGLAGRTPLGVLAFDCVGRRDLLGPDGMRAETTAVREALRNAPFAGFYAAGQIARVHGALGTHDLTLVTIAFG